MESKWLMGDGDFGSPMVNGSPRFDSDAKMLQIETTLEGLAEIRARAEARAAEYRLIRWEACLKLLMLNQARAEARAAEDRARGEARAAEFRAEMRNFMEVFARARRGLVSPQVGMSFETPTTSPRRHTSAETTGAFTPVASPVKRSDWYANTPTVGGYGMRYDMKETQNESSRRGYGGYQGGDDSSVESDGEVECPGTCICVYDDEDANVEYIHNPPDGFVRSCEGEDGEDCDCNCKCICTDTYFGESVSIPDLHGDGSVVSLQSYEDEDGFDDYDDGGAFDFDDYD